MQINASQAEKVLFAPGRSAAPAHPALAAFAHPCAAGFGPTPFSSVVSESESIFARGHADLAREQLAK
jgi:hypothetical protein